MGKGSACPPPGLKPGPRGWTWSKMAASIGASPKSGIDCMPWYSEHASPKTSECTSTNKCPEWMHPQMHSSLQWHDSIETNVYRNPNDMNPVRPLSMLDQSRSAQLNIITRFFRLHGETWTLNGPTQEEGVAEGHTTPERTLSATRTLQASPWQTEPMGQSPSKPREWLSWPARTRHSNLKKRMYDRSPKYKPTPFHWLFHGKIDPYFPKRLLLKAQMGPLFYKTLTFSERK